MQNKSLVQKLDPRLMSGALHVLQLAEQKGIQVAIDPKGIKKTDEKKETVKFLQMGKNYKPTTISQDTQSIIDKVGDSKDWLSSSKATLSIAKNNKKSESTSEKSTEEKETAKN